MTRTMVVWMGVEGLYPLSWSLVPTHIPTYDCGFSLGGSLYFHKSGQLWELMGVPLGVKLRAEKLGEGVEWNARTLAFKLNNFSADYLSCKPNPPPPTYLHFQGSKAFLIDDEKGTKTRLRWRHVSQAELAIKEIW